SRERLTATTDVVPPADVTMPVTCPAMASPLDASADCDWRRRLSPSWTFRLPANVFVTWTHVTSPPMAAPLMVLPQICRSAAVIVPPVAPTAPGPTTKPAPLPEVESPVVTATASDVFDASTDAVPAETRPRTCPATPSPVVASADWPRAARLSPFCTFAAPNVTLLSRTHLTDVPVTTEPTELPHSCCAGCRKVVPDPPDASGPMRPSVVFAASTEDTPEVTVPMTCPPTPSPLVALAFWGFVARLSPIWSLAVSREA